jgi:hypothetical protein
MQAIVPRRIARRGTLCHFGALLKAGLSKVSDMSNLVLLSGERVKRKKANQKKLVIGLKELLARAEAGELKALCYASIDSDNQNVTLGILHGQDTGLHEMIGLSRMLSDALMESARH